MTGSRSTRWRFAQLTTGSDVTSTVPSGFFTASAQVETPRIITPSSTAWPPTGMSQEATGRPSGMRASAILSARSAHRLTIGGAIEALTRGAYLALRAARRRKRSTRPPVSTSFCLPV